MLRVTQRAGCLETLHVRFGVGGKVEFLALHHITTMSSDDFPKIEPGCSISSLISPGDVEACEKILRHAAVWHRTHFTQDEARDVMKRVTSVFRFTLDMPPCSP